MKQMIQRMREEKGGFTLAELLIVVAIVAVLVAIAIPVLTSSLDKANAQHSRRVCFCNDQNYRKPKYSSYLYAQY